jgi:hypothetical protein
VGRHRPCGTAQAMWGRHRPCGTAQAMRGRHKPCGDGTGHVGWHRPCGDGRPRPSSRVKLDCRVPNPPFAFFGKESVDFDLPWSDRRPSRSMPDHSPRCHPERSRFSGGAKDLSRTRIRRSLVADDREKPPLEITGLGHPPMWGRPPSAVRSSETRLPGTPSSFRVLRERGCGF